jgi:hypothetical protein
LLATVIAADLSGDGAPSRHVARSAALAGGEVLPATLLLWMFPSNGTF